MYFDKKKISIEQKLIKNDKYYRNFKIIILHVSLFFFFLFLKEHVSLFVICSIEDRYSNEKMGRIMILISGIIGRSFLFSTLNSAIVGVAFSLHYWAEPMSFSGLIKFRLTQ